MNEKPLTKAVWRTKYKGFPLLVYVRLLVVLAYIFMCLWLCVCVCVCSCGLYCDWTKGYRVKQCKGCVWWAVVTVLSIRERDLRNCSYCFLESWFAEIQAWFLTCYCKLKKKDVMTCRRRLKQSKWDKTKTKSGKKKKDRKKNCKKTPTNKMKTNNMKLMLMHSCKLNSLPMNNNKMILWVVVWQTILERMVCVYCMQSATVCVFACEHVLMCAAACFRA